MATVPQEVSRPRLAVGLALLAGCLASGCVTTDGPLALKKSPALAPCQMVTRWEKCVATAPDPTKGGRPTPGLVGRVYLFGQDLATPVEGDGAISVELRVPTPQGLRHIETWNIDPATVARYQRKDAFGPGYSLFLPWATYRPEIAQVSLRVCYHPAGGAAPIYGESGLMALGGTAVVSNNQFTFPPLPEGASPSAPVPGAPLPGAPLPSAPLPSLPTPTPVPTLPTPTPAPGPGMNMATPPGPAPSSWATPQQ